MNLQALTERLGRIVGLTLGAALDRLFPADIHDVHFAGADWLSSKEEAEDAAEPRTGRLYSQLADWERELRDAWLHTDPPTGAADAVSPLPPRGAGGRSITDDVRDVIAVVLRAKRVDLAPAVAESAVTELMHHFHISRRPR